MASLRGRVARDGRTWWSLRSKVGGVETTIPLGPITRADAERARMDHERKVEGRDPRRLRGDAGDALEEFLASRVDDRAGTPETQRYYRATLGPFVRALVSAGKELHRWTTDDTRAWIRQHPTWAPRTTQKFLVCLRTFVAWARERDLDLADLVGSIRAPRVTRQQREALTPAQVSALVAAAEAHDWLELPVSLAAFAGLSTGDCRSLDWSEVDLERRRIVRPRKKSGRPLNIPITAQLHAILAARRAVAGPVCRMPTSSSAVCKAVRQLYARAGVPRARGDGLHALRRAFVSAGVAAGVDLASMADLIGDDPATVARYYTHSADERRADAVERIARAIGGADAARARGSG